MTFRVRGDAATKLSTSGQYAGAGIFSQLAPLVTIKGDRIKRIAITPSISGQIRFSTDSMQLQIGYTYDQDGQPIDIPADTAFYLEETYVL